MSTSTRRGAWSNLRYFYFSFGLFCIHIGEFLTFAAVVLCVFANIGQLSNNIVTRNIRYVSVDTTGLGDALSRAGQNVNNLYASLSPRPLARATVSRTTTNGVSTTTVPVSSRVISARALSATLASSSSPPTLSSRMLPKTLVRTCSTSSPRPPSVTPPTSDASASLPCTSSLSARAWLSSLGSQELLSHRFAFPVPPFIALLSALALGVGAALLTAIYVKAKDSINNANYGITVHYGNALWITWAAFAAVALSIVPYIISCCTGRSDDY